jgi:hypothetical protein
MKITIDDVAKTIKTEGNVNLKDLLDFLKGMEISPKDYTLIGTETIIQCVPYYEEKYIPYNPCEPCSPTWPNNPTWVITCNANSNTK